MKLSKIIRQPAMLFLPAVLTEPSSPSLMFITAASMEVLRKMLPYMMSVIISLTIIMILLVIYHVSRNHHKPQ
ncbi:hypothetical protein KJS94_01515 [Flavihumibacter rivuli]|uniref:hypothetical protein n=1 Tax=Flavihumibacter rivuli TaxID=2838156 RepID=UPI001BDE7F07|nr:hypothetical protein [Flavihumibacter rivuli]ULQ56874.1 hypothetical protein KJS94_01515 [Flavihumibacter rivuli]